MCLPHEQRTQGKNTAEVRVRGSSGVRANDPLWRTAASIVTLQSMHGFFGTRRSKSQSSATIAGTTPVPATKTRSSDFQSYTGPLMSTEPIAVSALATQAATILLRRIEIAAPNDCKRNPIKANGMANAIDWRNENSTKALSPSQWSRS